MSTINALEGLDLPPERDAEYSAGKKKHRKPIKIFSTNRVDCNTKDYDSGVGGAEKIFNNESSFW